MIELKAQFLTLSTFEKSVTQKLNFMFFLPFRRLQQPKQPP